MVARPQFCPPAPKFRPPRRTPSLVNLRSYFARHSPLPCLRVTLAKEAQQGQEVTRHASIAIRRVIGPKSAPILKRAVIRIKATKSKPILKAHPGYVHYTTMEEIPTGEVVTAGMFLVNKHPAIILFDSGASHSFMSQTFASKHDQKIIEVDNGGYSISLAQLSLILFLLNLHVLGVMTV